MEQSAVEWLIGEAMKLLVQATEGKLNEDTLEDDIYGLVIKAKQMESDNLEKLKNFNVWKEWKNK